MSSPLSLPDYLQSIERSEEKHLHGEIINSTAFLSIHPSIRRLIARDWLPLIECSKLLLRFFLWDRFFQQGSQSFTLAVFAAVSFTLSSSKELHWRRRRRSQISAIGAQLPSTLADDRLIWSRMRRRGEDNQCINESHRSFSFFPFSCSIFSDNGEISRAISPNGWS